MGVELPEHTSASQLNTYASCPRKYSLRYLEKTPPEDRSPSLVLGSVVHSAIGWFFEAKITGESPAPVDAAELGAILRAGNTSGIEVYQEVIGAPGEAVGDASPQAGPSAAPPGSSTSARCSS